MEDINQTLNAAIRSKDMDTIRNILSTSMVQDPGFNKGVFAERLNRCFTAGITEEAIFVDFEGKPFDENSQNWTMRYYAEQQTEFRYNFSRKRLEHLKNVAKTLYPASSPLRRTAAPGGSGTGHGGGDLPVWLIPAAIGAAALVLLFILLG